MVMATILPAILAHSEEEFIEKVNRVRVLGLPLHIDVMDGIFVPDTTWAPPERMRELLEGIEYEAHLMVSNPEHAVPVWIAAGANRVIFHAESTTHEKMICRATSPHCDKLMIALNPDTPISHVTSIIGDFAGVLIMGVVPGKNGQPFQDIAIEKVSAVKALRPDALVGVDGGVKPTNAVELVKAGADLLVAGSALTEAQDCQSALLAFKQALNETEPLARVMTPPDFSVN